MPLVDSVNYHSWHLFVLKVKNRKKFSEHLSNNGIHTVIHYPKIIPQQSAYSENRQKLEDFKIAYSNQSKIISIPIFPLMKKNEINKVISVINSY